MSGNNSLCKNCGHEHHPMDACRIKLCADEPTLRDRMAMAALTGFLANSGKMPKGIITHEDIAVEVYKYADAMMKQREKPNEDR